MIHSYEMDGIRFKTGDVLITTDGDEASYLGRTWELAGSLLTGEADHALFYAGPGPKFIEAGPKGIITYEMPGTHWNAEPLLTERLFLDRLIGTIDPYEYLNLSPEREAEVRQGVIDYCLANLGKPYNYDFFDPDREDKFYCSQLVYKALLAVTGIHVHTSVDTPPGIRRAVTPQEVWAGTPGSRRRVPLTPLRAKEQRVPVEIPLKEGVVRIRAVVAEARAHAIPHH
jgi:hypothetical protein